MVLISEEIKSTALPDGHTLNEEHGALNSSLERQSRQNNFPPTNIFLIGDDDSDLDVIVSSIDQEPTEQHNFSILQNVLEFVGGVASGFAIAQVIPWHLRPLRSTVTKVFTFDLNY